MGNQIPVEVADGFRSRITQGVVARYSGFAQKAFSTRLVKPLTRDLSKLEENLFVEAGKTSTVIEGLSETPFEDVNNMLDWTQRRENDLRKRGQGFETKSS